MKFTFSAKLSLWIGLALTFPINAAFAAVEGSGAHGGGAVVCFDRAPVVYGMPNYIYEDRMTDEGKKHVVSAVLLEFYKGYEKAKSSAFYETYHDVSSADQVTSGIQDFFRGIPYFYTQLETAQKTIGKIENAIPAENGLGRIHDSGLDPHLPRECAIFQAAERDVDLLTYDPVIFKAMTPFQRGLLQFHENVYYVASELVGYPEVAAKDSVSTQLLILSILTSNDLSSPLLIEKLKRYGFGTYVDTISMKAARSYLMNLHSLVIADLLRLKEIAANESDLPEKNKLIASVKEILAELAMPDTTNLDSMAAVRARPFEVFRSEFIAALGGFPAGDRESNGFDLDQAVHRLKWNLAKLQGVFVGW